MSQPDPVIENRFTYHKPFGDQPDRFVKLRDKAKELAYLIHELCPVCRESAIAQSELQGVVMFANAAIVLNEIAPEQKQ